MLTSKGIRKCIEMGPLESVLKWDHLFGDPVCNRL